MVSVLDKDATFLKTAEKFAMGQFKEKQGKSNTSEDSLFALSWECDRFKKLVDMNKELKSTVCSLQNKLSENNWRFGNVPHELSKMHQSLLKYAQSIYSKK